jgi:molecular chaperone GrpE (heat shock protein)
MDKQPDINTGGVEIPVKVKPLRHGEKQKHRIAIADAAPVQVAMIAEGPSPEEVARQHQEEIMKRDERIAELEEQIKRLSAEFENFRRRQERRFEETSKFAAENVITEFIPVLDSLRLACRSVNLPQGDPAQLIKGLCMISGQLDETLKKLASPR